MNSNAVIDTPAATGVQRTTMANEEQPTRIDRISRNLYDSVPMEMKASSRRTAKPQTKANTVANTEALLHLRDAALELGISFPTIKQWIYKKKIHSLQTAGGHHRIPRAEVDRLLFRTRGRNEKERNDVIRRVSGRNQLVGRVDSVRISGLMAEVKISIGGQQITSIITAASAREMQLKPGQTAAALIKATEVMILRI
ncbi:MAG: TOBE domain-containing protein [Terriglobales bacterium]